MIHAASTSTAFRERNQNLPVSSCVPRADQPTPSRLVEVQHTWISVDQHLSTCSLKLGLYACSHDLLGWRWSLQHGFYMNTSSQTVCSLGDLDSFLMSSYSFLGLHFSPCISSVPMCSYGSKGETPPLRPMSLSQAERISSLTSWFPSFRVCFTSPTSYTFGRYTRAGMPVSSFQ